MSDKADNKLLRTSIDKYLVKNENEPTMNFIRDIIFEKEVIVDALSFTDF